MKQEIKTLKSQITNIDNLEDKKIQIYIEKNNKKIKKGM